MFGLRANRHSFGISFSLHPVSMVLPPGEKTGMLCLSNKNVQSAYHMGPIPNRVVVKYVMMYPIFVKSAANCGISSVAVSDDLSTFPVAVPTLICGALFGRTMQSCWVNVEVS